MPPAQSSFAGTPLLQRNAPGYNTFDRQAPLVVGRFQRILLQTKLLVIWPVAYGLTVCLTTGSFAFCLTSLITAIQATSSHSTIVLDSSENTWSPGSAFSGLLVLQLANIFQPAGSAIFDGAWNTWRFSPFYCLLDLGTTVLQVIKLTTLYRVSISQTCLIICATRHRSFRVRRAETPHVLETVIAEVNQDLEDVYRSLQRRRLLSLFLSTITVVQFVKIMAVRGAPATIALSYVLACIFFTYWLVNEVICEIVRWKRRDLDFWDLPTLTEACLLFRPNWSMVRRPLFQILLHFSQWIAISTVAFACLGIGRELPSFVRQRGRELASLGLIIWLHALPFIIFLAVLTVVDDFIDHGQRPHFLIHCWYSVQGLGIETLVLIFFLTVFDQQKTWKPDWVDRLGKF